VLASLDDAQMGEAGMGGDHPIAWCHAMDRGRAWYTGMGHTVESFAEPPFRGHLREGIRWAMGETP
jgi:cytochrome c